jgi:class 3 adenylate cyclase
MYSFKPNYEYSSKGPVGICVSIDPTELANFDVRLLNLGDVKVPSKPIDVLAVMFDLEGFTNFARQVDPQLTIPNFLSDFLEWLFTAIKNQLIISEGLAKYKKLSLEESESILWAELPFYSKFMGDGVLFLWRIDLDKIIGIDPSRPADKLQYEIQEFLCNIIASQYEVCKEYKSFVKTVETQHVDPPPILRCGIARGTAIPIGNGSDFVGPCINIASRLQKFNGITFTFSARGIDRAGFSGQFRDVFVKKRASIRGIGEHELVYVLTTEYEALDDELKAKFSEP